MTVTDILKVSVMVNGDLFLNGNLVTLPRLEQALGQHAKANANAVVWYFRQNAAGEPPPVAMDVMKLIASSRLSIRLSSKPDFSDSVGPADPAFEHIFAPIREKAAQRHLMVLRPDGRYLQLPALDIAFTPPRMIAAIEQILPSGDKQNVAVIGETAWAVADAPSLEAANRAIPFFGLLMGLPSIGHAVWIFDAAAAAVLSAGCRDADLLIVDSGRLPALPPDWQIAAAKEMRSSRILVHDRATYQLRNL